jgi:methylated-DNA-[protein]-cysteine S-methyltransferase
MKQKQNFFYSNAKIEGKDFLVLSSAKGIKKLIIDDATDLKGLTKLRKDDPYLFNIFPQLEEYFKFKRKKFDIPLDTGGSDFQKKVWHDLRKIPFGKVITYKELALKNGGINYARAVGKAVGTNPVPIIIPCHRVINSSGSLGGYLCGVQFKEKLLELEGAFSLELF